MRLARPSLWTGEGSAKGEAWRTRVIYQTNLLTSYAAGRRAQLLAGKYKYWVYRHSGAEHPRLHHLALDGIALPPDHPVILPVLTGCSSRLQAAIFSFWAGVMAPMPMLGRSLL
jgi:hypothetical protein